MTRDMESTDRSGNLSALSASQRSRNHCSMLPPASLTPHRHRDPTLPSATAEVLDAYADSLRWLVGAVDRGLTGAVDSRRASADFARFRESGAPDFLNTIEHYADLNLQASDELERRYFRDGMALPESA